MEPEEGSLLAAADALAALEDAQEENTTEQPQQAEPTQQDTVQAGEPEEQEEQPEQAEEGEEGQTGEDKSASEEVEIEFEGERYKVPPKLKDGLLRQADYTRKTQALAAKEREFEAQKKELPQKIEAHYRDQITTLQTLLGDAVQQDAKTNWAELLESDPVEYLRQKELSEQRQRAFAEMQANIQTRQQQHLQNVLATEREKLLERFPEWKDAKVAEKATNEIRSFLQTNGFAKEEVDGITDHRILVVIDKALKFDALSRKDVAAKKIEKLPPKVERPGAASENKDNPQRKAVLRARQTGKLDDAAAAIMQLSD